MPGYGYAPSDAPHHRALYAPWLVPGAFGAPWPGTGAAVGTFRATLVWLLKSPQPWVVPGSTEPQPGTPPCRTGATDARPEWLQVLGEHPEAVVTRLLERTSAMWEHYYGQLVGAGADGTLRFLDHKNALGTSNSTMPPPPDSRHDRGSLLDVDSSSPTLRPQMVGDDADG